MSAELWEQLKGMEPLTLRVAWLEQRRFAQLLNRFGLTIPQFQVLRSIGRSTVLSMTDLADETLQCSATMTGIVDRLERMGLVTRSRDDQDRRRMLVELTTAGRETLGHVRDQRERDLAQTLESLTESDAHELLRLLRLYLEALIDQHEPALASETQLLPDAR